MKFLRRDTLRLSKLGRGRKKKQTWRKPTGRDNKMREKRRGYPVMVSIGYRSDKDGRSKVDDLKPITVNNLNDLEKVGKENIAIIGKMGIKNKIQVLRKAKEDRIKVGNLDVEEFLKNNKIKEKAK